MPVPNGASPAEQQVKIQTFTEKQSLNLEPSSSSFIGPRVGSPHGSNTAVPTGPQVRVATLDSGEELLRRIGNVSTEELRLAASRDPPFEFSLENILCEATEELPI